MFSKRKFPSCVITFLATSIALYSCSNPSPSNSASNSSFDSSQNCESKVRELETKIQELNTEIEETKTKLREAEFELFEFSGFKYTKTYNGVITHYYEDIRAAFDRAEDDIEVLEDEISDLESDNRSLRMKLINCD